MLCDDFNGKAGLERTAQVGLGTPERVPERRNETQQVENGRLLIYNHGPVTVIGIGSLAVPLVGRRDERHELSRTTALYQPGVRDERISVAPGCCTWLHLGRIDRGSTQARVRNWHTKTQHAVIKK